MIQSLSPAPPITHTVLGQTSVLRAYILIGLTIITFLTTLTFVLPPFFEWAEWLALPTATATAVLLTFGMQIPLLLTTLAFAAIALSTSFRLVTNLLYGVVVFQLIQGALAFVLGSATFGVPALAIISFSIFMIIRVRRTATETSNVTTRFAHVLRGKTELALAAYAAFILGVGGFFIGNAYLRALQKLNTTSLVTSSHIAPTEYTGLSFAAHDFKVQLRFDPNATSVTTYNAKAAFPVNTVTITGNRLNTTKPLQITIRKVGPVAQNPAIDPRSCAVPGTSTVHGTTLIAHTTVMGQSTALCQYESGLQGASAYIKTAGTVYYLQFYDPVAAPSHQPVSAEELMAIAASITIGPL